MQAAPRDSVVEHINLLSPHDHKCVFDKNLAKATGFYLIISRAVLVVSTVV